MDGIETKADEMLRSPLGCAFLLAAAASGLKPEDVASPSNCIYLAAYAQNDIEVWQADYQAIRDEILRQGQQHRDLALAVLGQPAAANWFGPLDTGQQVHVPVKRQNQPPDQDTFVVPASPLSGWERYAEKSSGGMFTYTSTGGTASIFVALDQGVGDIGGGGHQQAPYECWMLSADPSARVYEVDGPQAWHDLCVRYPTSGKSGPGTPDFSRDAGRLVPDWPAVAADWDAVHLTFGGLLTAHQVRVESDAGWTYLWSWDIEQTQWLRWKFTGVERMPDREPQKSPLDGLFHPLFVSRANFYKHGPSTTPSPSVTSFYKVPVDFPDLQPAPEQPPEVYLVRRGGGSQRQRAIMGHSDWSVDREVISNTTPLPILRPPPIEVSESGRLLIKVVTDSAPTSMEIRHYGELDPNGRASGKILMKTVWEHPRMYSYRAVENAEALKYNAEDGMPGWELEIEMPQSMDESYINLWGIWFEPGRGACSANWTMSAKWSAGRCGEL